MALGKTKIILVFILSILLIQSLLAQKSVDNYKKNSVQTNTSFKEGEFIKYRVHYGILNAGFITFNLNNGNRNGQDLFHATVKGRTSGAGKFFFVVDDTYESYFTKGAVKPIFHKRRVDEGGYLIRRDKYFDHENKTVTVDDLQKNTKNVYPIQNVQDMVSAFYYLRNLDITNTKEGDEASVNLFFDGQTYPFKLRFLKRETIRTKFGKVQTWKVQPMVQKGRIFKDEESLTLWITDDPNKILIRFKASLKIGSLKADLDAFSGLANSFPVVMEK
jgi:hypothetical protein